MLFKFGENRLIFAETINIFVKFKMAAAAILDFQNFHFSLNRPMHAILLRKIVKFGNDQSTR